VTKGWLADPVWCTFGLLAEPGKHVALRLRFGACETKELRDEAQKDHEEAEEDEQNESGGNDASGALSEAENRPLEDTDSDEEISEQCELCGDTIVSTRHDINTSYQEVAFVKMQMFVDRDRLPAAALEFLLQREKFTEMRMCGGSQESSYSQVRCCFDKFRLKDMDTTI
jgi:hypothetical protein